MPLCKAMTSGGGAEHRATNRPDHPLGTWAVPGGWPCSIQLSQCRGPSVPWLPQELPAPRPAPALSAVALKDLILVSLESWPPPLRWFSVSSGQALAKDPAFRGYRTTQEGLPAHSVPEPCLAWTSLVLGGNWPCLLAQIEFSSNR